MWTAGIFEAALVTIGLLILRGLTKAWGLNWHVNSQLQLFLSLVVFAPLLGLWWWLTRQPPDEQRRKTGGAKQMVAPNRGGYLRGLFAHFGGQQEEEEEETDDEDSEEEGEEEEEEETSNDSRRGSNYSTFLDSEEEQNTNNTNINNNNKESPRQADSLATRPAPVADSVAYSYRELARDEIELDEQKPLSYGAFSVVYRGRWRGVECAVKQLSVPTVDPKAKQEFRKEASLMQELGHHPNIVTFFGAVTTGHCMWLVAEFHKMGSIHEFYLRYRRKMAMVTPVAGGTQQTVDSAGAGSLSDSAPAIPLDLIVKLAADAALGILHLHRENVIHRDIAARNVLVGGSFKSGFRAVITDFGLSRVKTTAGTTVSNIGPVKWMAPEAIMAKAYSEASDAWSFGVLLWEMITGRVPWEDEDALQVAMKVGKEGQTLPLPSGCDEVLAELMTSCWAQDPARRPTFEELHARLQTRYEELKDEAAAERRTSRGGKQRVPSPPLGVSNQTSSPATAAAASVGATTPPEEPASSNAMLLSHKDKDGGGWESSDDDDDDDDDDQGEENPEWERLAIAQAAEDYRMALK